MDHMSLHEMREDKDVFFRDHPMSPLTPEQKRTFTGLRYFPENPALQLTLALDTDVPDDVIVMQTSTGDDQRYLRAGRVSFAVDGQDVTLTLYQSEQGGDLFVPFRDATSAHETYGAGRYFETHAAHDGTVTLDFNLAYNPYCAYNDAWSCPLPPAENWLPVPIRAGELAFDGHE